MAVDKVDYTNFFRCLSNIKADPTIQDDELLIPLKGVLLDIGKECKDAWSSWVKSYIQEASASIKFSRCISACLRYLEAVQWTEEEEENLRELLARINIDDPKTADIKYQFPFIIRSSQTKSSMAETDEPTTTPIVEEPSRAELLGSNNWEGLLHPLNLSLRRLILLSGDFCQCTNDSFNGDKFSKYAGSCHYSKESFFHDVKFEAADDYQVASRSSAKEGLWNGM